MANGTFERSDPYSHEPQVGPLGAGRPLEVEGRELSPSSAKHLLTV